MITLQKTSKNKSCSLFFLTNSILNDETKKNKEKKTYLVDEQTRQTCESCNLS